MLNVTAWPSEVSNYHVWARVESGREHTLRIPEGFRCWKTSPPAPDAPVLALFDKAGSTHLQRTSRAALATGRGADRPFAWQRQAMGKVLSPGWRLFPDELPPAGAICCTMFFDIERELGDSAGFGRFERGGAIGRFVDRFAYPGEPDPVDPRRWATFAWRLARDFERAHAQLAASLSAGAMLRV